VKHLPRDVRKKIILYLLVPYLAVSIAGYILWGMSFAIGFILLATGVLLALHTHHVYMLRRLDERRLADYHQMEAFNGLMSLLQLRAPLPPTRGWAASPDYLALVAGEIMGQRPQLILECGSGISTVIAAYCLEKIGSGKIVSLEQDAAHAGRTSDMLRLHGLDEYAEVVHSPIAEIEVDGNFMQWYDTRALDGLDGIGMVVVDGPSLSKGPLRRYPVLPLVADHLDKEAVVILDDADRPDERAVFARWASEYPAAVSRFEWTEKGTSILRFE